MLRDVVGVRRRWARAPVIHDASHFYHEKRAAWVSISVHACDPVPIAMGLRLAALRAARAPLLFYGSVSHGLGTTKFTKLVGWNLY